MIMVQVRIEKKSKITAEIFKKYLCLILTNLTCETNYYIHFSWAFKIHKR